MRQLAPIFAAALALGCSGAARQGDADVGRQPPPADARAEAVWLREIGQGPAQTAKACGRGANDPIARALCQDPAPRLESLQDLYRVLKLETRYDERLAAVTTHSLGLSARAVSAVNPRVIVFQSFAAEHALTVDRIHAVAFARGEQLVEMIGFDPGKRDFNLYLLAFEQACNATRCLPSDLLTSKVERGWTAWTLYGGEDLEDTGLDCLSCHRPDGPGSPTRLLMRQLFNPWMHWDAFGGVAKSACNPLDFPADEVDLAAAVDIVGDRLGAITQLEGPLGRYGGVPIAELTQMDGGHDLSSLQFLAARAILGEEGELDRTFGEPHPLDSYRILCERMLRPTNPLAAWSQYRETLTSGGLPVPYHSPDVLDSHKRSDVLARFAGFLDESSAAEAFELASSLMSDDAQRAIGFVPSDEDPPEVVLRQMCVRCHDAATPPHLRRARFNAEALDNLRGEMAAEVRRRISLPRRSPELMPPLRAGELPAAVIQRLDAYLAGR